MLKSYYSQFFVEAGCDEAGRGCLAGPVVASAVIFEKDYTHPILTDSKKLNKKQREELREEIKKEAVCWAIGEASHEEIDEINILNASFLAMHRAVDQLKVRPGLLLIDGNRFNPHAISHTCIIKGDALYYSIAAASILAKTYRDDLMRNLCKKYPHYGWSTNVGYPTVSHRNALLIHGLSPIHRKTFKMFQLDEAGETNGESEKCLEN
ncbi:MAG: ribonuclease HII [Bacteroidota bacterium]|nr:ribonuclease HII [Bacteroidota bacterium]